jgi:P-loop Domain of unknown function (DUF2791)
MGNMTEDGLKYRRALEALRNGIPNSDVVKVLGCGQPDIEQRFRQNLQRCADGFAEGKQIPGFLVTGDFGSGKSHVLEYLQHLALSQHFVCSRVVISKETPLYDHGKVLKAAIESAELPDQKGQAVQELASRLDYNSQAYGDFYQWCDQSLGQVGPMLCATLLLHERLNNNPELIEQITGFWSGEHLALSTVRQALKQLRLGSLIKLRATPARQLALHRTAFILRLALAAGYRGWVVLLDELELIGRYSFLQRAAAYAVLASWLGRSAAEQYPGLVTIGAITADFDSAVLEAKGDRESLRAKLESRNRDEYRLMIPRAEAGMRTIAREGMALVRPSAQQMQQTYARLKEIHGQAYGWTPPELEHAEETLTRRMRSHVRRWINEWDLRRFDAATMVQTEEEELRPTYREDSQIEIPAETRDEQSSDEPHE